jgi:hypothetical protein
MIAMTKAALRLVATVASAALFAAIAAADEGSQLDTNRPSEVTEAATPQAVGVERAKLSADLAAYGRQTGDPMALLLAGSIIAEVGAEETKRQKVSERTGDAAPVPEGIKTDRPTLTAEALFAEARNLARSDSELLARIERTAQRQTKGRPDARAPRRHSDTVDAFSSDWYTITFRGGEPARLALIGDGDTNLDLYIYDENGEIICSDTEPTDRAICAWYPKWTGNVRIKISNCGNVYNRYSLLTN